MEPLIPLVTVAPPAWLWVATNAMSGVVFLASVAALGATVAERDASWLSMVRGTCVFGAGLLVGLALLLASMLSLELGIAVALLELHAELIAGHAHRPVTVVR